MKIPHLVQYQGSKRNLAHRIIEFFPRKFNRLVEPFAGSAAISIACAFYKYTEKFLINDANPPLLNLLRLVINEPDDVANKYAKLWHQQHKNPLEYYKKCRDRFNNSHDPVIFLYLLARCVKGAVRYNSNGEFNQSPDKRRLGTTPEKMEKNIFSISDLLKDKCEFMSSDYKEVLKFAKKGDLVYMDPPYQGVCGNKDSRYYSGIDFQDFISALEDLNNREIDYVVSYDGKCGSKEYGNELPNYLGLTRILIEAGRSSQATLLGRDQQTIESLYISDKIFKRTKSNKELSRNIPLNLIRGADDESEYSKEFLELLESIVAKRAKTVIDHILKHGFITTEDLKNTYGYNHPPRAVRDVKEYGVPIQMFRVDGADGRKIAAYKFGNFTKEKFSKLSGRTALSKKIKEKLIDKYGSKDFIYGDQVDKSELQVDHRIPFEVGGEPAIFDIDNFMLLSGSANRAKSWSCENCINFKELKKKEICLSCYWAYPDNYTHVAMKEIRRVDLIWQGDEVDIYENIKQQSENLHQEIQVFIKDIINKEMKGK